MKYHVEVVLSSYVEWFLYTQVMEYLLVAVIKDSKANPDLAVNAVVLEFGKFMKIIVCFSEDVRIYTDQHFNAFDMKQ